MTTATAPAAAPEQQNQEIVALAQNVATTAAEIRKLPELPAYQQLQKDQRGLAHAAVAATLQAIKGLRKTVADTFDPIVEKAHATHKEAVAQRKKHDGPLEEAERLAKQRIAAYEGHEQRLRYEQEQRELAAARKAEEEARLAEAIAAEAAAKEAGASPEAAEAAVQEVLQAPTFVPPPVVAREVPKAAGVSTRLIWKGEVTNLTELVKAVAENRAPAQFLLPNERAINEYARSTSGKFPVPGITFRSDTSVSVR